MRVRVASREMWQPAGHGGRAMKGLYIDGAWVAPHGTEALDVLDPTTEQAIGAIRLGDAEDVDRAVRAAARAFPRWSRTPERERLGYVREIGRLVAAHADELTELIVADLGMPRAMAREAQVSAPAEIFMMAAELAEGLSVPSHPPGAAANTLVVREPAGVVGAITPWNFPLQEIAAKTAPALAVGCTVVVKPSEVVPLAALRLAEQGSVAQAGGHRERGDRRPLRRRLGGGDRGGQGARARGLLPAPARPWREAAWCGPCGRDRLCAVLPIHSLRIGWLMARIAGRFGRVVRKSGGGGSRRTLRPAAAWLSVRKGQSAVVSQP
ncbi:aldehyde dehydrogenase family protein [Nonomuraea sp. K274]|uniref:Aldehyde dehydrogenase family protein n=1 Tax=Nonomuraea cypriaca TaxID=1187855 RepID=A0A931A7I1_9ACTN|nr:aldehyde dehydrogenase family protein [Nonomuraea cypriaca]MBF8187696.1 aldehyde dehydrogenase family protein [Nonomuraea cypriaca]